MYELFAALLVVSPFTGTPFWKAATTNEAAANVLCAEWGEKMAANKSTESFRRTSYVTTVGLQT